MGCTYLIVCRNALVITSDVAKSCNRNTQCFLFENVYNTVRARFFFFRASMEQSSEFMLLLGRLVSLGAEGKLCSVVVCGVRMLIHASS